MSITKPVGLLIVTLCMVGCTSMTPKSTQIKPPIAIGTLTITNDTSKRVDITNALQRVTFADTNNDTYITSNEFHFDIVPLDDRIRPI